MSHDFVYLFCIIVIQSHWVTQGLSLFFGKKEKEIENSNLHGGLSEKRKDFPKCKKSSSKCFIMKLMKNE